MVPFQQRRRGQTKRLSKTRVQKRERLFFSECLLQRVCETPVTICLYTYKTTRLGKHVADAMNPTTHTLLIGFMRAKRGVASLDFRSKCVNSPKEVLKVHLTIGMQRET